MGDPGGDSTERTHGRDIMRYDGDHEDRVVYSWARFNEYLVSVHDRGTRGIQTKFCPWCGVRLPVSKRDVVLAREEREARGR